MVDLQRVRSRAMLEASVNVCPHLFEVFAENGGAPRGLDHPRYPRVEGVDGTGRMIGRRVDGQNTCRFLCNFLGRLCYSWCPFNVFISDIILLVLDIIIIIIITLFKHQNPK